jgi:hypothetical protein
MSVSQHTSALETIPLRASLIIQNDQLAVGHEVIAYRTDLLYQFRVKAAHVATVFRFEPYYVPAFSDQAPKAVVLQLEDPATGSKELTGRGEHQVPMADRWPGEFTERRHGVR